MADQRGLAGAVGPDHAEHGAARSGSGSQTRFLPPKKHDNPATRTTAESSVAGLAVIDHVSLRLGVGLVATPDQIDNFFEADIQQSGLREEGVDAVSESVETLHAHPRRSARRRRKCRQCAGWQAPPPPPIHGRRGPRCWR